MTMFHFLTISNLNISKGILILLDACVLLRESGSIFRLHVVGAETSEISTEHFNCEISRRSLQRHVMYHGRQYGQDKEEYFSEANVFVHPTLNDCFPVVLLEAMQHSLPIISTPVGAIPDMVVDGDNGLLVPENEPVLLADAMRKLIENPEVAHDMGDRGNSFFLQKYTASVFECNLLNIFNEFHM